VRVGGAIALRLPLTSSVERLLYGAKFASLQDRIGSVATVAGPKLAGGFLVRNGC